MAKLNWEIHQPEYGYQFNVVANTRSDAIAAAQAKYLADTDWQRELVERETGFVRSPIPDYVAVKVGRRAQFWQ